MATLEERLAAARAGQGLEARLERARAALAGAAEKTAGLYPDQLTARDLLAQSPLPAREDVAALEQGVRQSAGELAADVPGMAKRALETSGTHYRTLAHGLGLPVDAPSPEAADRYIRDVTEMLLTVGGGKVAGAVASKAADAAKYLGRGFRTMPGAERFLAREAAHVVPAGGAGQTAGLRELFGPTISGVAAGTAVDMLDPTPWELTDKPVAGAAGVATTAAVAKNTLDDLLVANPRWRDLVMRPSSGNAARLIGGTLGYLAAKGINLGRDSIDDVISFFSGEAEPPATGPNAPGGNSAAPAPPPARGEAMLGPIGGAALPVDPNLLLAQRLMAR